jgi:hypothetical protein
MCVLIDKFEWQEMHEYAEQCYLLERILVLVLVDSLSMGIMRQEKGGYSTFFSAENIRPAPPERAATGQ